MIPAPAGVFARFSATSVGGSEQYLPVVAFNERDGHPYVVSPSHANIVRAEDAELYGLTYTGLVSTATVDPFPAQR